MHLFTFNNNMRSKFLSDKRLLSGVKILPETLNKRSTEADEGNAAFYLINMAFIFGFFVQAAYLCHSRRGDDMSLTRNFP